MKAPNVSHAGLRFSCETAGNMICTPFTGQPVKGVF